MPPTSSRQKIKLVGDLSLLVEDLLGATLFCADVNEHDHKQEKDHHAADVDEYLNARDELGPRENK